MRLKEWLDAERGRYGALAAHLGVSLSRVSQMASSGVPKMYLVKIRDFSGGLVTLEDMLDAADRDPPVPAESKVGA